MLSGSWLSCILLNWWKSRGEKVSNNCSAPVEGTFCQAAAPTGSDSPRLLLEVATAGSISCFSQRGAPWSRALCPGLGRAFVSCWEPVLLPLCRCLAEQESSLLCNGSAFIPTAYSGTERCPISAPGARCARTCSAGQPAPMPPSQEIKFFSLTFLCTGPWPRWDFCVRFGCRYTCHTQEMLCFPWFSNTWSDAIP